MLHPAENALLPYTVVIHTLVLFILKGNLVTLRVTEFSLPIYTKARITTVYPKLRCTV